MQPQNILFQVVTPEQLLDSVRAIIRYELAQAYPANGATQQESNDELLTIKEAAELLDVCVATIHQHKRIGLLSYQKIGGRAYIRRSAVLAAGTQHQRSKKPARTKGS
jgi:hypothetical protein